MGTIGELEKEYGDRVDFKVLGLWTDEGKTEGAKYDWQGSRHGLVAFDADGNPKTILPGHNFGREKIEAAIQEAMR